MAWEVEYTDEFAGWSESLTEQEQIAVDTCVSWKTWDQSAVSLFKRGEGFPPRCDA
jgi:hypothetical protein